MIKLLCTGLFALLFRQNTLKRAGIAALLLLPLAACGLTNPIYTLNNQVRQAVYSYEREQRGPVDELIIHFQRDEPRVKFEGQNQNGGRTVWLYRQGAAEFFALRPQTATYLYIQAIEYSNNYHTATVTVYRGDGSGYNGRQLTLNQTDNGGWVVTGDTPLTETGP